MGQPATNLRQSPLRTPDPRDDIHPTHKPYASRTVGRLAPVLITAWGIVWITSHASQHSYAHTLFQTLALAESVIALFFRRRKPVGALAGVLVAYLAFQLDPLLLPPLLIALFTVATLTERRTVLLAAAAAVTTVAALPLSGRAAVDLAGYLVPRLLAVATTAAIGLGVQTHFAKKTPSSKSPTSPSATPSSPPSAISASPSSAGS